MPRAQAGSTGSRFRDVHGTLGPFFVPSPRAVPATEWPVADPKTYTQEEFDAVVAERDAQKANHDALIKEAKTAKAALKNYDGVDPTEFKALKAAAEEADRKKAAAEGDFTKLQAQMAEKHQVELEAERKRTTKALAALEKRKVAKLTEALAQAEVLPDMMDLLVLKGSASVRLREGEDDWDEFVADAKGNPLVADGAGTPMTLAQFVDKDLKAKYPGAFKGTGSSGGGAAKSTASGGHTSFNPATDDGQAFMRNVAAISKGEMTLKPS